ncbi:peptidoglycan-binding protein [Ancylothrix sp. D3o]|uniref:peptidoglycan-binding protein n=1 Tax=Ancylothrix sp. D3o TaxID=2953691 RepID=UPI0021BB2686|nr:peptidoglycan-binding protein [Ancylothrix sp. D3o]
MTPVQLAQTDAPPTTPPPTLQAGDRGPAVEQLQTSLKKLGFYTETVDGFYGETTIDAVAKFQQSVGLTSDGIAGAITTQRLQTAVQKSQESIVKTSQPKPNPAKKPGLLQGKRGFFLLGLGGIALVAIVGGLFYLLMRSGEETEPDEYDQQDRQLKPKVPQTQKFDTSKQLESTSKPQQNYENNGFSEWGTNPSEQHDAPQLVNKTGEALAFDEMPRLSKIDIVEELIRDLPTLDQFKRRKTIWELGQRGDSRAIQPLVNLLIDSDSQQRSLILAALSEIGTRTLKPMNRALALSLEDDNAEVRKNAIRDLSRIYDLLLQMSQLLRRAVDDEDVEVQETARWALGQLNNIRFVAGVDTPQRRSDSGSSRDNSHDNLS